MKTAILDIAASNVCNYSCYGCIASSVKAVGIPKSMAKSEHPCSLKPGLSLHPDVLSGFIKARFHPEKTVLQFTGGEPLLLDSIVYLLKEFAAYPKIVVTNGSLFQAFRKHFPNFDHYSIKWKLSYHPEMRKLGDLMKDVEGMPPEKTLINYYAHPAWIREGMIIDHVKAMADSGIRYHVNPFKGMHDGQWYDKNSEIYKDSGILKWDAEWTDYSLFGIRPDGTVWQCHKRECGDVYEDRLDTLNPDMPKCEKDGIVMCDCYCAAYALWPQMFGK